MNEIIISGKGKPDEKYKNIYLDEDTGNLYKNGKIFNHLDSRNNDIYIIKTTKVLNSNGVINIHPNAKYMKIIWEKENVLLTIMPCEYLIKDKKIYMNNQEIINCNSDIYIILF